MTLRTRRPLVRDGRRRTTWRGVDRALSRRVVGSGCVLIVLVGGFVAYQRLAGAGSLPVGHAVYVQTDGLARLLETRAVVHLGTASGVPVVVSATAACTPSQVVEFSIHSSAQFRQHTGLGAVRVRASCGREGTTSAGARLAVRKSELVGRLGPGRAAFDIAFVSTGSTPVEVIVDLGLSGRFDTTYQAEHVQPERASWRGRGAVRAAGTTITPDVAANAHVIENVFLVLVGVVLGWIALPQPSRHRR